jgi:hypothetical protein
MTVEIAQQAAALGQALLLGGLLGLIYDLFRIARVRVKLPLLGPALDLLFWLMSTCALFLWSQWAWGGEVRLYGAAFCLVGGCLYFWLFSRWFLRLGYLLADFVTFLWEILTFPLWIAGTAAKKIGKFLKNTFLSLRKWYRINHTIKEMEHVACRREIRGKGGVCDAVQTRRFSHQNRDTGLAGLHGDLSSGSAEQNSDRRTATGRSVPTGCRPAFGKSTARRRHRTQRRP